MRLVLLSSTLLSLWGSSCAMKEWRGGHADARLIVLVWAQRKQGAVGGGGSDECRRSTTAEGIEQWLYWGGADRLPTVVELFHEREVACKRSLLRGVVRAEMWLSMRSDFAGREVVQRMRAMASAVEASYGRTEDAPWVPRLMLCCDGVPGTVETVWPPSMCRSQYNVVGIGRSENMWPYHGSMHQVLIEVAVRADSARVPRIIPMPGTVIGDPLADALKDLGLKGVRPAITMPGPTAIALPKESAGTTHVAGQARQVGEMIVQDLKAKAIEGRLCFGVVCEAAVFVRADSPTPFWAIFSGMAAIAATCEGRPVRLVVHDEE